MAKKDEAQYFKKIGKDGLEFTLGKPFTDRINSGPLLHNIAAIFSVLANQYTGDTVSIIDIGCGSGWTSSMLGKAGHSVLGVDISPEAIVAAKARFENSNVKFMVVDYDNLGKASKYDVAVFIDSLHHADNPKKTLKAALSVIKQGGICIVCEPGAGHSKAPDAVEAVKKYRVTEQDMPPKLVLKLAKQVGFRHAEVFAHPSLLHRAAYKVPHGSSPKALLLRSPGIRSLALLYCGSLKKRNEGLVILYA